jgi:hypothetical protein
LANIPVSVEPEQLPDELGFHDVTRDFQFA